MLNPFIFELRGNPNILHRPFFVDACLFWQGHIEAKEVVTATVVTSVLMDEDEWKTQIRLMLQGLQHIGSHFSLPFALSLGDDTVITIEGES